MRVKLWRIAPLSAMLVFPVLGMLYGLVNGPHGQVHSLATKWDVMIPFIKIFVLPYSIWIFYIYACLVYFYFKDPAVYYRSLITYAISAIVCYAIYLTFQTTVTRPIVIGDDLLSRMLAYVYGRDEPFNCFPSIHSFSSYMVMRELYKSGFKTRWNQLLIYGMSVTVILSTLFIKQHVLLDIVAAIVLVETVSLLVHKLHWTDFSYAGKDFSGRAKV